MAQDSHRAVITLFMLALAAVPADMCTNSSNPAANNQRALPALQEPVKKANTGSIADTVVSLHCIKADVEVPIEARKLLTRLKHQVRDLIGEAINDANPSLASNSLRARIWDRLTAKGVTIGQPREHSIKEYEWESKYPYGDFYDVKINNTLKHSGFLAVTTTMDIPCGRDSSLYLFRKRHRVWRLILAQEANSYEDISGAQGLFDHRISFDSFKRLYVVTVNVNPWCTSAWQSIRYAVLRPGLSSDKPVVIISGKETIYLGVDPPAYKLVVKRKSFSIRFAGEANQSQIMAGVITRDRVIRYRIDGNRPVRISH